MVHNDPQHPELARESQDVDTPPLRVEEAPHHTGRGRCCISRFWWGSVSMADRGLQVARQMRISPRPTRRKKCEKRRNSCVGCTLPHAIICRIWLSSKRRDRRRGKRRSQRRSRSRRRNKFGSVLRIWRRARMLFRFPRRLDGRFLYLCLSICMWHLFFFFFFLVINQFRRPLLACLCDLTGYNNWGKDYGAMRSCKLISGLFFFFFWKK